MPEPERVSLRGALFSVLRSLSFVGGSFLLDLTGQGKVLVQKCDTNAGLYPHTSFYLLRFGEESPCPVEKIAEK